MKKEITLDIKMNIDKDKFEKDMKRLNYMGNKLNDEMKDYIIMNTKSIDNRTIEVEPSLDIDRLINHLN